MCGIVHCSVICERVLKANEERSLCTRNSNGSDGPKFEEELEASRVLSRNVGLIRPFFEHTELCEGTMNNIKQPAQPKWELVACAMAEVLGIAQRQGITPADFVRMLDSGMRMSDS